MEWKILQNTPTIVQTILNQWRHNYVLNIHGVTYDNNNHVVIVLTRKKKEIKNDK